ncbi:MAG: uracil-DNA glycosylase [Pseudomonadota bacterium]|nr:uracil-DNA glycosylase [Pseudomonadota bacterium]
MTLHLDERQRAMLAEMGIRPRLPAARTRRRAEAGEAGAETQAAETRVPADQAPPTARPPVAPLRPAAPREAAVAPVPASALGPRPEGVADMDWATLESTVAACRACGLCAGRTQTVFGVGARVADWMVIGEAPGENEDRQGQPFVGQAGKLLDNMLAAIGVSRQAALGPETDASEKADGQGREKQGVYIANVLKCRPPGNRNPQPDEIAQCEPYLRRQVALVRPKIILAMGRFAVQSLLRTTEPIGRLRGRVHQYEGVPVVVTYHPAYLLRALPEKAKAWQDLCLALEVMRG